MSNNCDQAYKLARNEYFTFIRDAKKAFDDSKLQTLCNNKNKNPKQWWSLLKQVNKSNSGSTSLAPLEIGESLQITKIRPMHLTIFF